MAECGGCGKSIVWAETPDGKKQPFDREPDPRGLRVLLGRGPNRPPLALPVVMIHNSAPIEGCRYMPHHATCEKVEDFR